MTTFETPGKVLVRVALGSGDVRIDATPDPRTDVELVALRDDDATRSAIAEAIVEARLRGDRTEIVVELPKKGGWSLLGRGPSVGVRVRCPHDADVEVSTASADVTTTGPLGDVEAKSASGDLALDVVAGLRAATASGDVTAREILGEGNAKTASGDVAVRLAHGALSLNLASGDAVVGQAKGPLSIATVSGDQEIEAVERGEIKLQSVSGDVRVGVTPGLLLSIDATSVSGSMQSELPMEDGLQPEGEPVIHLRARTVSGDVRIVRAAGIRI
jgi:DUF4097 and DUF4098 domain-containing protein YvlB